MSTQRIAARFATRRDAEMAVETLVQEYEVDRSRVSVTPEGAENTAGTDAAGSDAREEDGAYAGAVKVAAELDGALLERVRASLAEYGARFDD
jgi:hypothetical protein